MLELAITHAGTAGTQNLTNPNLIVTKALLVARAYDPQMQKNRYWIANPPQKLSLGADGFDPGSNFMATITAGGTAIVQMYDWPTSGLYAGSRRYWVEGVVGNSMSAFFSMQQYRAEWLNNSRVWKLQVVFNQQIGNSPQAAVEQNEFYGWEELADNEPLPYEGDEPPENNTWSTTTQDQTGKPWGGWGNHPKNPNGTAGTPSNPNGTVIPNPQTPKDDTPGVLKPKDDLPFPVPGTDSGDIVSDRNNTGVITAAFLKILTAIFGLVNTALPDIPDPMPRAGPDGYTVPFFGNLLFPPGSPLWRPLAHIMLLFNDFLPVKEVFGVFILTATILSAILTYRGGKMLINVIRGSGA